MTAHTVTQADRELFKLLFDYGRPQVGAYVDAGKLDHNPNMQAIAAHRIAAEQSRDDVIEECAKVAKTVWIEGGIDVIIDADAAYQLCERAEQAIRAMKGSKT